MKRFKEESSLTSTIFFLKCYKAVRVVVLWSEVCSHFVEELVLLRGINYDN